MPAADPIAPLLDEHGTIVLDGGLATELERRGADLRDPLWSAKVLVEDPKLILGVHTSYFEAGARLIGGCCGTGPEDVRAIRAALGR